jgi:hypothetical protein
MTTMTRCVFGPAPLQRRAALAGLCGALLCGLASTAAWGQAPRNFPATALRGELVVTQPPEVLLNNRNARLAPGARIWGSNHLMQMSGALIGQKLMVHYTRDAQGQMLEVWILTPAEFARRPWPTTPAQASSWSFNADTQSWTQP